MHKITPKLLQNDLKLKRLLLMKYWKLAKLFRIKLLSSKVERNSTKSVPGIIAEIL